MYVLNIIIASTFFISSDAFSVDDFEKCSVKDDKCMKRSMMKTMKSIGKDGIPELGVPATDPLTVKNFSVTLLQSLVLTFKKGVIKGIKDCEFKKKHIDLEKKTESVKIVCDLTVKGHFIISGSSPTIQSLLGRVSIRGEGNAKVKIDKLSLDFTVPLKLKKHDDDKLYLEYPRDKSKYKFDVEKVTFAAENIYIGKQDISNFVVTYLNENWKFIMHNFGKVFLNKAMDYYFEFAKNLFNQIPIDKMVTDDLTNYVNK